MRAGYIAQFGIHGDPRVAQAWRNATIADDPPRHSNVRGTLAYAFTTANTRATQIYINLADNTQLDAQGFAPFGVIVSGIEVIDRIYSGYGENGDWRVASGAWRAVQAIRQSPIAIRQSPLAHFGYDPLMTTLVGADGCSAGWLCIFLDLPSRRLGSKVFPTIRELFDAAPELDLLAIDIPIGLTDGGGRACDIEARAVLRGKRASSVFSAPIRPALYAQTYAEACKASFDIQQRKVSKQAWAIYPKIRELDELLQSDAGLRRRVYEVHPEVTFAAWHGAPIVEPKKRKEGFTARHRLVSQHFSASAYETVRARYLRRDVADDDILDAFAALWTGERILRGAAQSLPPAPETDAAGLPMRIVY